MRLLSVRLILSLIVGITLVSLGFSYYEVLREKRVLRSQLERSSEELGESFALSVEKSWDSARTLQRTRTAIRKPRTSARGRGLRSARQVGCDHARVAANTGNCSERRDSRDHRESLAELIWSSRQIPCPHFRVAAAQGRRGAGRPRRGARCGLHSRTKPAHLARSIFPNARPGISHRVHHGAHCALEHNRTDRAGCAMDAGSSHGQNLIPTANA